jgi:hypothetical protein
MNARMRCAMNLSAHESVVNPQRAMTEAMAGLAIARRRRLAGWAGALAGNWAECAFAVGEWDAILALAADLEAEGLLPADRERQHLRRRLPRPGLPRGRRGGVGGHRTHAPAAAGGLPGGPVLPRILRSPGLRGG